MWNPFKTDDSCPVEPAARAWIDTRFVWLVTTFGKAPRDVRVLLPVPADFPDPFRGRPDDLRPMFDRVCGYLGVDPTPFVVSVFDDDAGPPPSFNPDGTSNGASAFYLYDAAADPARPGARVPAVAVRRSLLADPEGLVAALAHEVGHELLIGGGRVGPSDVDHEPLTDLLTVYLGFGVFTANATFREANGTAVGWHRWQVSRHGYLSQRELGYALALFARSRGEVSPPWARHLRPDVSAPFKQALRFLDTLAHRGG